MRVRFPCVAPFSSRLISLFTCTCSAQPHDVHFTWAVCSAEFVWSPLVRLFTWLMVGKYAVHGCRAEAKGLRPVTIGSLSSHGSAEGSWSTNQVSWQVLGRRSRRSSPWPRPSPKTPASSNAAHRSNASGKGSRATPSQSARR